MFFNYDLRLLNQQMELFLLNEASHSTSKLAIIGGIGILSLYGIYKLLSYESQQEEQDHLVESGRKPAGIYNQGNTCFVNSLLQALASLSSFEHNLQQAVRQFKHDNNSQILITELLHVIQKINSNSQSIDVVHLLSLISEVKEGLINLEQQDAHELFSALIGCFDESLGRQKRMDLSASIREEEEDDVVENSMIGYTKSSITCTRCKVETAIKIHPFNDLSLEIRQPQVKDIRAALRQLEREEPIQNWICTNCTIAAHLRKLNIALKALRGPNREKLEFVGKAIIEYLQNQDLAQSDVSQVNQNLQTFVLNFQKEYQAMAEDPQRDTIFVELQNQQSTIVKKTVVTKYPKILVIHLKQLVVNPLTGYPQLIRKHIAFDESLLIEGKTRERKYCLKSLLTHIGNQSMGHYYTFRRMQDDRWYVISDSYSRPCQWLHVRQSRAYMLFYEMQ